MVANLDHGGSLVLGAKPGRAEWAEDLGVKDYTSLNTEIIYHAGCRTRYDRTLWSIAQNTVRLMQKAGIDMGVDFNESCCGGRAYQMGYQEEALHQAQMNMERFKKAGVKTLVTGCAECYFSFKVLYDQFGLKGDLKILHTSEYFNQLVKDGKLKPVKAVNRTVTYHDPCHLGRQGEPYIRWNGKRVPGQLIIFDPPKEFRRGSKGIYDAPRDLLQSIPGLKLVEMARHKEFAWCCGSGGGVKETNSEFAKWTANERVKEARETGAAALVSGCPGCESLLGAALSENGAAIRVYDIVEILAQSVL
jgi:Fe-S oxidoreductase